MPSFWRNKKVLVTGASGLLGSNLVKKLTKEKANVSAIVRDYTYESELIKSGEFNKINVIRGELEEFELVLRSLNEYEIDTVFHLGAQTLVPTANRNPLSTFNSNIKGTWNILEACREFGKVRRIVVASTDKVYGTHEQLPYTESMELKGIHPYDVSKVCADLISQSYFKTYNLPVTITRCGNIYGPGDLNFSRIIPGTIRAGLQNELLDIRSDGEFVRDYVYMEDIVDGNMRLAELDEKKIVGEVFNLSTENRFSVLEVISKISEIMNKKIKIRILNDAKNEIKAQYLSCEKAHRLLGWKAKQTFEEGIRKTIPWYSEYFGIA